MQVKTLYRIWFATCCIVALVMVGLFCLLAAL